MIGVLTALGLMSGTSMDGIDLAVIRTNGETVAALGPWATVPYAPRLREWLGAAVAAPDALGGDEQAALEREITDAHAAAIRGFLKEPVDVIGFHGHTLVHRPERRQTVQLGDGARLASTVGIDVVAAFRAADVAAGGQGAPFAPLYHAALARGLDQPLAVLNLGGVGNVTYLDGERILAFDTGPASAMIDDWVRRHTGHLFDEDGRLAAAGRVDAAVLERLMEDPFFALPPPKSLDRNAFSMAAVDGLSLEDGAATLAAFTARSVAAGVRHLPARPRRWLVTGGGRRNPVLMANLGRELEAPVEPVEAVGWQGDALEAQAFGFLAVRSLRGLPLSLPSTTGVPRPMPGGVRHRPAPRLPSVAAT